MFCVLVSRDVRVWKYALKYCDGDICRTICCQRSFKLWQRLWFAVIFRWDWNATHFSNVRCESDLHNKRWKVFKWGRRKAAFQWQEPFALRTKVTLVISSYFVPLYIAGAVLDWYIICKICANNVIKYLLSFFMHYRNSLHSGQRFSWS